MLPEARTPPAGTDVASRIGLTSGQSAGGAWLQFSLRDPVAECCAAAQVFAHPELVERVEMQWFTVHEPRRIVEAVATLRTRGEAVTLGAVCALTALCRSLVLELADPISEHRWDADSGALFERLHDLFRRRRVVLIALALLDDAHGAADVVDAIDRRRAALAEAGR